MGLKLSDKEIEQIISDTKDKPKQSLISRFLAKDDNKEKQKLLENLDKEEAKLEKKKQVLRQKEDLLKKKELEVMEGVKQLSREEYQWNKRKVRLEKEIRKLADVKEKASDELATVQNELSGLEEQFRQKQKQLEDDEKALAKRENEITKKVTLLENDAKKLSDEEETVMQKIKEMEDNKKILLKEENKVVEHLKVLKEKRDKVEKDIIFMIETKKKTEERIQSAEERLRELEKHWENKTFEFKSHFNYYDGKKRELIPILKELKDDVDELAQKENEILNTTKKFERAKKLMKKSESSVMEKISNLKIKESEVDKKIKESAKLLDLIERSKEWKAQIPAIEKEYNRYQKHVAEEKDKLDKLTKEMTAKMYMWKNKELELIKKESDLARRHRIISEKEYELKRQEQLLKDKRFEYMQEEEHVSPVITPEPDIDFVEHPEVLHMLRKARELMSEKRMREAYTFIDKIQEAYDKLDESDSEKKRIAYELMELNTDIKLMNLS